MPTTREVVHGVRWDSPCGAESPAGWLVVGATAPVASSELNANRKAAARHWIMKRAALSPVLLSHPPKATDGHLRPTSLPIAARVRRIRVYFS